MNQSSAPLPPVDPVRPAVPPPPPGYVPPVVSSGPAAPRSGVFSKALQSLLAFVLMLSIGLNVYFGLIVYMAFDRGVIETTWASGDRHHRVVILPVQGMIDNDTAIFIRQALATITPENTKAIVLRVDSGGGGVAASDRIWHELRTFQEKHPDLPIVASFGGVAASGGYYIAAPADLIMAEPSCITGSIGVIAFQFTLEKLMEKIGVSPEVLVASGSPEKEMGNNPFRPWTEADRQQMQVIVDYAYDLFLERVLASRAVLTPEQLAVVATGAIYTTGAAIELNLVDESGFLRDAVRRAATMGGVPESVTPHAVVLSRAQPFGLGMLLGMRGQSIPSLQSVDPNTAMRWLHEAASPQLMYQAFLPGGGAGQ